MRRPVILLATGVLVALLAACGKSSAPPTDGCPRGVSQEAYQTGMYECPDRSLVFTFDNAADRDAWVHTATQFGTVLESEGATWVKVREAGS